MAVRYWLSVLAACGALSVSLPQRVEAAPYAFNDISNHAFAAFAEQLSPREILIAKKNSCKLPEWYDKTGEEKAEIDPVSGECVPNGCVSSGYTPKKCEGFGPPVKPIECPSGTLSDGEKCLPISPPEEIIEIENNFCPEGESLIDGDCIKPGNKLPDADDEIKLCSDGLLMVDGECVEIIDPPGPDDLIDIIKECPAGFTLVDGECDPEELKPPKEPGPGESLTEGECYWVNQGAMGLGLAVNVDGPGVMVILL